MQTMENHGDKQNKHVSSMKPTQRVMLINILKNFMIWKNCLI